LRIQVGQSKIKQRIISTAGTTRQRGFAGDRGWTIMARVVTAIKRYASLLSS